MNIPFFSPKKPKAKKSAKALIGAAYNVYNYRRDVLSKSDAQKLHDLIEKAEEAFDDNKMDKYEPISKELEAHMKLCGGKIYPWGFWTDNVDVVLVAGILALTVRSFFFTPFQIPTNSMYPTYYGMTPQVYSSADKDLGMFEKISRFAFYGASNYVLKAPETGEVFAEIIPVRNGEGELAYTFYYQEKPSRWLGVLPSKKNQYTFLINDKILEFDLPANFTIDSVMKQAFPFGTTSDGDKDYFNAINKNANIISKGRRQFVKLGTFQKGQNILNFDILSGDTLLVDKLTYNFRKPKVGESFVFRTGSIDYNGKKMEDQYYIKRLVAQGGDTLQIKGSTLFRNGEPATGADAFKYNADQAGLYCGYKGREALADEKIVKVPEKSYYALGDNSQSSLDSRYWGSVPDKVVVGKPVVIFYPFTSRWGAAK